MKATDEARRSDDLPSARSPLQPADIRQARRWARLLPRHDRLRQAAERVLEGAAGPYEGVGDALGRLRYPQAHRWQAIALSAFLLGESKIEGEWREDALAVLRGLASRRATPQGPLQALWRAAAKASAFAAVLAAAVVVGWFVGGTYGPATVPYLDVVTHDAATTLEAFLIVTCVAAAVCLGSLLGPILDYAAGDRIRYAAMMALGRQRDMESIGLLAAACCEPLSEAPRTARKALLELLPAVSASDYGNLPPLAVPQLCRALLAHAGMRGNGWGIDIGLAEGILEALDQAADGRAVEPVQRVARHSLSLSLRQRAAAALPTLLARQAEERRTGRLLRPADPPDNRARLLRPAAAIAPETDLLRPAHPAFDTPPEELLRPVGQVAAETD